MARPYDQSKFLQALESGMDRETIISEMEKLGTQIELPSGEIFEFGLAKDRGDSWDDIIETFRQGKMLDPSRGPVGSTVSGINTGIANVVGFPAEILGSAAKWGVVKPIDYALEKAGVSEDNVIRKELKGSIPSLENPIGGTKFFKENYFNPLGGEDATYEKKSDLPTNERIFATGGEIVGASVPVIGTQAKLGKVGKEFKGTVSKYFEPLLSHFRKNPGKAFSSELGYAVGAGQGGATAYAMFPDSFYAQLIGEIAGSVLSPASLVSRVSSGSFDQLKKLFGMFSSEAQARNAATDLKKAFQEMGYKPEDYMNVLSKKPEVDGLTSAQQSKFDGFIYLENTLKRGDSEFARKVDEKGETGLIALREMMRTLVANGDPMALEMAAQLEKQYFRKMVDVELNAAKKKLGELTSGVGAGDAQKSSEEFVSVMNEAKANLKNLENGYWESAKTVFNQTAPSTQGTVDAITSVEGSFLTKFGEPGLPQWMINARNYMNPQDADLTTESLDEIGAIANKLIQKGFADPDNLNATSSAMDVTIEDLVKMKRRFQALGRAAGASGDSDMARKYYELADGVINDLSKVDNDLVKSATNFSRELQETVYKTNVNDLLSRTTGDGSLVTREGQVLEQLTSGSNINKNLNIEESKNIVELSNTAKPTDKIVEGGDPSLYYNPKRVTEKEISDPNFAAVSSREAPLTVDPQLETYLETLVRSANVSAKDGNLDQLDVNGVAKWMDENKTLLEKFPNFYTRLQKKSDDWKAQADEIKRLETKKEEIIGDEVLATVLNTSDPAEAIATLLKQPNKLENLDRLVKMINAPDLPKNVNMAESLKTNIFAAIKKNASSQTDDTWDVQKVMKDFTDPFTEGGDNLLTIMQKNGIMDTKEAERFNALLTEANEVTIVLKNQYSMNEPPLGATSAIYNLMTRVLGATIGGASAVGNVTGTPLVAAQAGSQTAQRIMDKLPKAKTLDILKEAALDPQAMQDLLAKGGTPKELAERFNRLESWMIGSGLIKAEEELDETERMLRENEMTPE